MAMLSIFLRFVFNSLEELIWYIIGLVLFVIVFSIINFFLFSTDKKEGDKENPKTDEKPWKQALRKLFDSDDSEKMY